MPATGAARTFEDRFEYLIEIDGIAHAGFSQASELAFEMDTVSYREGGRKHPYKSPGLVNFPPITLDRGAVASDSDLYDWAVECASIAEQGGVIEPRFRRNFDLVVLDRDKRPLKRWRVIDAWVKKFSAGSWDSNASEKTIEQVVIEYDSFERRAV